MRPRRQRGENDEKPRGGLIARWLAAFAPHVAIDCGGRFAAALGRLNRRVMGRIIIAAALGLLVFSGSACAQPASALENMVLDAMPRPARCGRTSEPIFFCRHDTPGQHVALEIGATNDGLSASLTYNYDNPAALKYFAMVRRLFMAMGIAEKAIDECVYDPQWQPDGASTSPFILRCRRVEFTGRVTHEFFAFYHRMPTWPML